MREQEKQRQRERSKCGRRDGGKKRTGTKKKKKQDPNVATEETSLMKERGSGRRVVEGLRHAI